MTYPFCPECGLDWNDCKCGGKKMDEFTTKHLQRWADDALHEDEREETVHKLTTYFEHNPDAQSWSWPFMLDIIERNEKLRISV